ncbi:MAG: dUTP diphosphatase [Bacilli bacterium]|nr:dUTP diphosphatase [Bacilli bacterium]
MKERGFEIIKGWENKDINLPIRKTALSAGYDTEAAEDTIIPPFKSGIKPTLIKTGIKAYCKDNEWIMVANRSSNPGKKHLVLANGIGIVDADYYENEDNDGHIMFAYFNMSGEEVLIKKGEVIGQLVFMNYLTSDDDNAKGKRKGGFGSTSK